MNDTIAFSVFADLHWREGDWSGCEARLDAILDRALRSKAEFVIHCGDFCHDVAAARGMIAKCPVSCHTLLNAEPVHAIVRLSMDGDVEIDGMKGSHFLGITPESLGLDTTDSDGLKFETDVLSAKFKI